MIRILSVAVPARILILVLSETAILFGCYFFAVWLDPDIAEIATFVQFDSGLPRITVAVGIVLLGLFLRNLYSQVRIRSRLELVQELLTVFGGAFIGQGLVHYLARDLTIPRKVMLIGSPVAFVALLAWRLFFDAAARDQKSAQRLVFLGISPAVSELAAHLRRRPEIGLRPVGYLADQPGDPEEPLPWLGRFSRLDDVIENEQPGSLVIANRRDVVPEWSETFLELDFGGVRIEEASALYERTFGRIRASEAWPQRFLFSDVFEPDAATARLQSVYSPILAAVLLLALSPFVALVALLIRLTSKGPVFLHRTCEGMGGVPFTLTQFRTDGVPLGSILRRLGLDSLPAFWSVLKGNMSIVGPAPERAETAAVLATAIPFYRQRTRVKPGLTGWEQVHRDQDHPADTVRRLEYDLYYLKNLALSLDSAVLMMALKSRLF